MAGHKKKNTNDAGGNETILQRSLEEVMHSSIMPYAEYIILERALPRVEDGLKPVQRRILYTMNELSLTPDKPHRKSARIVGDTLGKYHPHGDSSVYDAMVRMAQGFNMRAPLVDGHGNFGSVDGDSAAAMRYTEARLTPLSMELLRDLDKATVPFSLNFDDTLKEPDLLPGRFPNLLVNGASGIAIGLATNIPPHNLGEVIDGVIAQIDKPDIQLKEIMKYVKGPDFPTGGYLISQSEIEKVYATGKGKLILRAKVDVENGTNGKKLLVITELPYQVNKANLLEKILKLSEEKKGVLSGIADIRDESDRNGMRAVIETKRDADVEKIINYLYKYSDLQVTFGANMVAIADGKPAQMGLLEINRYYINHQKDVITRRTQFDLEKAKAREHILEGLMIAINNIDRVIAIIRSSKTPKQAKEGLMENFELSDIQAQAILDMRLQRLTGLEILALEKEYQDIKILIKKLEEILSSEKKLMAVIKKELLEIKKKYADDRRTKLVDDASKGEIKDEDLMIVEDTLITLSHGGYIKRIPLRFMNRSNRESEILDNADKDYLEFIVEASTDQRILLFTDIGNCYQIDCMAIPEAKWKEKGSLLFGFINAFEAGEQVVSILPVKNFSEGSDLLFFTQDGMVKRTPLVDYKSRITKIQACKLKKEDKIISVELVQDGTSILMITEQGMSIKFDNGEVSATGRVTTGVKGISLSIGDQVLFAKQVSDEGEIIIITDKGYGKRSLIVDYELQKRAGKGLKTYNFMKRGSNGTRGIGAYYVKEPFDLIFIQKNGEITRVNTEKIPLEVRFSKGKPLVMVVMDNDIELLYKDLI